MVAHATTMEQTLLYDLREPMSSRIFREQIELLNDEGMKPFVVLSFEAKYSPMLLFEIRQFVQAQQIELALASTWMTSEELLAKKPKISAFTYAKLIDFDEELVIPSRNTNNPFVFITADPGEMTRVVAKLNQNDEITFIIQPDEFCLSTIELFVTQNTIESITNQTTFRYFQPVGPYETLEQIGFWIILFFSFFILIFTVIVVLSRITTAKKFQVRR
ncbi:MAG: hypothetical protein ACRC3J_10245 [Culicoidibacterales bacterium]